MSEPTTGEQTVHLFRDGIPPKFREPVAAAIDREIAEAVAPYIEREARTPHILVVLGPPSFVSMAEARAALATEAE